jgi:prepilin-type N-terminal cleavage/methylation domain-containing protein
MQNQRGFTLVEMLVVIAVVSILSGIVLFSITQYINKGKDASMQGNLAILITAGEVYYDRNTTGNSYVGFCESSVVTNAFFQIPALTGSNCTIASKGVPCCKSIQNQWAVCSQEVTDLTRAYCVDSRGIKKEICHASCDSTIVECPNNDLSTCTQ